MSQLKRIVLPIASGLAGSIFLTGIYIGLVSWAESFTHAVQYLWQDRFITLPLILGFGVQVSLYVILKTRLFVPLHHTGPSGVMTGTSGAASTISMVACCAHHVTDVLPILGLTAAATFLAQYRTPFMLVGLATTLLGISVMTFMIYKERRKARLHAQIPTTMETA